MADRVDVAVVGAGVAGAATAHALARAGRRALVLEQLAPGHDRGSSHGTSRIFRLSYPEESWVRLAQEAQAGWRALEEEAAEELLTPVGCLDAGRFAPDNARALRALGLPHELLNGREAAERWPLGADASETLLFQPDGASIRADRALAAFLAGADVREGARVTRLVPQEGLVVLETEAGDVEARAAVVTAGAWARPLLQTAGIDLPVTVTRETVAYFAHPGEAVPCLIDDDVPDQPAPAHAAVRATYSLPAPGAGLKVALHHFGPVADPDAAGGPDPDSVAWAAAWAARRHPGAGAPTATDTCLYTSTGDERFVLQRRGRIVVGSACSGHAFKFAPVVGARVAALVGEVLG